MTVKAMHRQDKSCKSDETEQHRTTRAAGVIGFWTALSRILGFVRDMVIALFLGAGMGADAFFVAFRIPNLLRRLFGEGALAAAFVPTYVETLRREGTHRAAELARSAFTLTAIVLLCVTAAGIAFSPAIVRVIAPGFLDDPDKFALTVSLNRTMFPYILFISLVALMSGVLNAFGHFAAPAAAPIVLNLCMIFSVVTLCTLGKWQAFYALAWGVLVAGLLQLLLQVPFLERKGVKFRPRFVFRDPALKRIGVLFVPAAFGGAVYQLNVFIATVLASMLPAGGVSWLYYADRLVELPLGVFAIALGTAILPSMSRQAAENDLPGLSVSVCYGLRLIAFFTIPASVGLIVLREPIISVLFQRGLFTHGDTQATAYALLWYTTGLWAFSGLKVVNQAFFSLKDTRTPVWVALGSVVVNFCSGWYLMKSMAHGGLALATSLAAAFNVLILFTLLLRRLPSFPGGDLLFSLARILAASLIMGAPLVYVRTLSQWSEGLTVTNGLILAGCVLGGLILFLIACAVLRTPELKSLLALSRRLSS